MVVTGAEMLEDEAKLCKGGVKNLVILFHYCLPIVLRDLPWTAGEDEVGKIRCWAQVAGGVEVQHDTFDFSSIVIFKLEVSLPNIPMANGGQP